MSKLGYLFWACVVEVDAPNKVKYMCEANISLKWEAIISPTSIILKLSFFNSCEVKWYGRLWTFIFWAIRNTYLCVFFSTPVKEDWSSEIIINNSFKIFNSSHAIMWIFKYKQRYGTPFAPSQVDYNKLSVLQNSRQWHYAITPFFPLSWTTSFSVKFFPYRHIFTIWLWNNW